MERAFFRQIFIQKDSAANINISVGKNRGFFSPIFCSTVSVVFINPFETRAFAEYIFGNHIGVYCGDGAALRYIPAMICFFFYKISFSAITDCRKKVSSAFSVKKRRNIAVHICVLRYFFQRADIVFRHFSDNYFVVGQAWKFIKQIHNQSFSPLIFLFKVYPQYHKSASPFFPNRGRGRLSSSRERRRPPPEHRQQDSFLS